MALSLETWTEILFLSKDHGSNFISQCKSISSIISTICNAVRGNSVLRTDLIRTEYMIRPKTRIACEALHKLTSKSITKLPNWMQETWNAIVHFIPHHTGHPIQQLQYTCYSSFLLVTHRMCAVFNVIAWISIAIQLLCNPGQVLHNSSSLENWPDVSSVSVSDSKLANYMHSSPHTL